ncbi:hypothetical protein ACVIWV_000421 [Bradyrhizobium diazoefficiens]
MLSNPFHAATRVAAKPWANDVASIRSHPKIRIMIALPRGAARMPVNAVT